MTFEISNAILAESGSLPPLGNLAYQYVLAANGLFIRAENAYLKALVPVAACELHGLDRYEPGVELLLPKVPVGILRSVLYSARRKMPREAMYQLAFGPSGWRVAMPPQSGTPTALQFSELAGTIVDLHSHHSMAAFFSGTDDRDEQGFRIYVVIGRLDVEWPDIYCRVGVYGHTLPIPASIIFDDVYPFVDLFSPESEPSDEEETDSLIVESLAELAE